MREIEFRAWLKNENKMVDVISINTNDKVIAYIDKDKKELIVNCDFDNIELMQWTGQRDKTRTEEYPEGKKIFEDDIIESEEFGVGTVYYDEECGQYLVKLYEEGYIGIGKADIDFKIVGNIYENPNLLE